MQVGERKVYVGLLSGERFLKLGVAEVAQSAGAYRHVIEFRVHKVALGQQ